MAADGNGQAKPGAITLATYKEHTIKPQWCPSCGDFAVVKSIKDALVKLQIDPHDLVMAAGIGCSGRTFSYINGYSFHGVHGRAIPTATGVKLANEKLTVLALGGDGDGYAIGLGHFIHAIRRNVDLTYIVMDNQDYGLTKGQVSPTSQIGYKTKTTPYGNVEAPIDPMALALASGIGFLSRGFSGNPTHLTTLIERAIAHKGFALVEIFSPCVIFNKVNTYEWYKGRCVNVDEDPTYDRHDLQMAFRRISDQEHIALGVLYESDRPSFEALRPGRSDVPVVHQTLTDADYSPLLHEFL